MTIQGRTLEQLFEVLFENESIEDKFWAWYTSRNNSQNSGKQLVSGSLELLQLLLNKEQEAFDQSISQFDKEMSVKNIDATSRVMKLISELSARSVEQLYL